MAGQRNVPTWIHEILDAIKAELISQHVFNKEMLFCSLEEDKVTPPGDQYATIVPGPQRPDQGVIAGGGLTVTPFSGLVGITIWSRLSVDQDKRDDAFLNDLTFGAFEKCRLVIAGLQMFDPLNANQDYLLAEAMRFADSGFIPRPRNTAGWGSVVAPFEIKWLANMTKNALT